MSIIGLWARRSGKWLAGIVAVMALAQAAFFVQTMNRTKGLEETFHGSYFGLFGWLAGTALILVLFLKGRDGKEKTNYTLRRLGVTPQKSFYLHAVHNTLCFLILWAAELLVAIALCLVFRAARPELWENQSMLLAFYRRPFLHGLLPLGDWYLYIKNILWCAIFGELTATSRNPFSCIPLASCLALIFPVEMGAGVPWAAILWGIAILLVISFAITTKKGQEAVFDGGEVEEK